MAHHIDDILARGDFPQELPHLKAEVGRINALPVSEKTELELPVGGLVKLRVLRSLWSWATGRQ